MARLFPENDVELSGDEDDTQPLLSDSDTPQLHRSPRQENLTAMESQPKLAPQYAAALCATMGAMAIGAVLGYSSPAGELLTHNTTDPSFVLTQEQNSWFSSSCNLGALVGSPIAGICINTFGRRGTMIYSILPFLIGWALIIAAQNFTMLLIGRIITGICCGLVSLSVPTYIGEYASAKIRGMLGSGFQLMVVIGVLFTYCMGAAFQNWRWIAATCSIFPCIFSVVMIFNKESPIFLLLKGKEEEAKAAMDFFRGSFYEGTSEELETMRASLERRQQKQATLSDLKIPYILKPFLISLSIMFFQQFCGVNAVLFNLGLIFEEAGSSLSPTVSSIIVGVVQVIATLIGALLMDRAGRKLLLTVSSAGMIVSLVALGTYFYLNVYNHEVAETIGWLPLLSLVVFIFAFSIGYGPIPWLMIGELFSPEVKELAGSIATSFNWLCAFVTTLMFEPLQKIIGNYGVYWLFSAISVINIVFVVIFVFETKGKTLQEISEHFGAPPTTLRSREGSSNVETLKH